MAISLIQEGINALTGEPQYRAAKGSVDPTKEKGKQNVGGQYAAYDPSMTQLGGTGDILLSIQAINMWSTDTGILGQIFSGIQEANSSLIGMWEILKVGTPGVISDEVQPDKTFYEAAAGEIAGETSFQPDLFGTDIVPYTGDADFDSEEGDGGGTMLDTLEEIQDDTALTVAAITETNSILTQGAKDRALDASEVRGEEDKGEKGGMLGALAGMFSGFTDMVKNLSTTQKSLLGIAALIAVMVFWDKISAALVKVLTPVLAFLHGTLFPILSELNQIILDQPGGYWTVGLGIGLIKTFGILKIFSTVVKSIIGVFKLMRLPFLLLGKIFKGLGTILTKIPLLGGYFKAFGNGIVKLLGTVAKGFGTFTKWIGTFGAKFSKVFSSGAGRIAKFFAPVLKFFRGMGATTAKFTGFIGRIFKGMKTGLSFVTKFPGIASFLKIGLSLGKAIPIVGQIIMIITGIFGFIKGALSGWKTGGIFGAITGGLIGLWDAVIGSIANLIFDIIGWVLKKLGFEKLGEFFSNLDFTWDGIKGGIMWVMDKIRWVFHKVVNGLKSMANKVIKALNWIPRVDIPLFEIKEFVPWSGDKTESAPALGSALPDGGEDADSEFGETPEVVSSGEMLLIQAEDTGFFEKQGIMNTSEIDRTKIDLMSVAALKHLLMVEGDDLHKKDIKFINAEILKREEEAKASESALIEDTAAKTETSTATVEKFVEDTGTTAATAVAVLTPDPIDPNYHLQVKGIPNLHKVDKQALLVMHQSGAISERILNTEIGYRQDNKHLYDRLGNYDTGTAYVATTATKQGVAPYTPATQAVPIDTTGIYDTTGPSTAETLALEGLTDTVTQEVLGVDKEIYPDLTLSDDESKEVTMTLGDLGITDKMVANFAANLDMSTPATIEYLQNAYTSKWEVEKDKELFAPMAADDLTVPDFTQDTTASMTSTLNQNVGGPPGSTSVVQAGASNQINWGEVALQESFDTMGQPNMNFMDSSTSMQDFSSTMVTNSLSVDSSDLVTARLNFVLPEIIHTG